MNKLQYSESKTLKLTNVLKYKINLADEDFNFRAELEKMQSYIKTNGAVQIGPLIQYTNPNINDVGELDIDITLMMQANNFIHNVQAPYRMESLLRVPGCMYCRYIGPEEKLKLAIDKINIEAFEKNEELNGDSYTIFISENEEEETMVADIFMPRKKR